MYQDEKQDDSEEQALHQEHEHEEQALHEAQERVEAELPEAHEHKERENSDKVIEVTIRTSTGKWSSRFERTDKISEVIAAALAHFNLEAGDYKLVRKSTEEMLDPHRTLGSYHIQDREVLNLIPPDGGGQ